MKDGDLFKRYESLVNGADRAFQRIAEQYTQEIKCKQGCADCCHAVFGLFLVEACALKEAFDALDRKERRKILARCDKADRALQRLHEKHGASRHGEVHASDVLGKERVCCPLLSDRDRCLLYPHRPITCRVYGIPTAIRGKARVCQKAGFKEGTSYPAFDLDRVHHELYLLSRELLAGYGTVDPEQASLLISVSRALRTPLEEILAENAGSIG